MPAPAGAFDFAPVERYALDVSPRSVGVGDLDQDGDQDLLAASYPGAMTVLRNDGHGRFRAGEVFGGGPGPTIVHLADVDADGHLDGVVGDYDAPAVTVLLGRGDATFEPARTFRTAASGVIEAEVADLDGDGDLDIATADSFGSTVSVLLGDGDGDFRRGDDLLVGFYPRELEASDFDRDGRQDLAIVGNTNGETVHIARGRGDGRFDVIGRYRAGVNASSVAIHDVDGDRRDDLLVTADGTNDLTILQGAGDGTFTVASVLPTRSYPYSVAVADFDDDGREDLVVGHTQADVVSLFAGSAAGRFGPRQDLDVGLPPTQVVVAPLDANRSPDLVLAGFGSLGQRHPVGVAFNRIPSRDAVAPTIEIARPAEGSTYRLGEPVAVQYRCADDAELIACTGTVPDGGWLDTSTPGEHRFEVRARDRAGNEARAERRYDVSPLPCLWLLARCAV
ncbi:MAG TPA: VCBS repeat-containing protein [Baekduia sp.]|nr:VCBS repeat-containing protein [Baekduia sp.]